MRARGYCSVAATHRTVPADVDDFVTGEDRRDDKRVLAMTGAAHQLGD